MTIYLDDRRTDAAGLIGKVQHAFAGFPLLYLAITRLREGHEVPIAIVELLISSAVIFTFLAEVRQTARHHKNPPPEHAHPAAGWFDLAAGVMLIFEAVHGEHHKSLYLRAPFFAGLVAIILGLFHGRLAQFRKHRRYLTLDEKGIHCRKSPIRHFRAQWTDLASVSTVPGSATFSQKNGKRHTLQLRTLRNADEVRKAIETHARTAGLLSPAQLSETGS